MPSQRDYDIQWRLLKILLAVAAGGAAFYVIVFRPGLWFPLALPGQ